MAPRKKNQTPAEQTAQDQEQKNIQTERDGDELEQTGKEPEREADELEQGDQEQDTGEAEQEGGEKAQPAPEPERDVFADIPNPCVYCGPSVRGVARQYTTYQGGIPNELKEFIKAHPAVRRLIVSTGQFASVRKRLETNGTAEAIIYKKVKSEL